MPVAKYHLAVPLQHDDINPTAIMMMNEPILSAAEIVQTIIITHQIIDKYEEGITIIKADTTSLYFTPDH